jgi:hypothetical protein
MLKTASNAIPAINPNNAPGSGSTRISASIACADSRRHRRPFSRIPLGVDATDHCARCNQEEQENN